MDIETLIRWLVAIFVSIAGALTIQSSSSRPPGGTPTMTVESPVLIDKVDVLTLESYPYQLNLVVSGQHPDGCDLPVQVEQRREGSTVYVRIYRNLDPTLLCPMVLVPYTGTIRLDGGFESGSYRIDVNGYTVDVKL